MTGTHVLGIIAAVTAALLAGSGSAQAQPIYDYLPEDVLVRGEVMSASADQGHTRTIVLGSFRMDVGRRSFAANDAVLWTRDIPYAAGLSEIEAYLEGGVRVTEPNGTTTRVEALVVRLRYKGDLRASVGQIADRPLDDLPLVGRAASARDESPLPPATSGQAAVQAAPVRRGPQAEAGPTPPTPGEDDAVTPPRRARRIRTPEPEDFVNVSFFADEKVLRDISAEGEEPSYVLVCRGNVRVGQGDADSMRYIEIRADAAVMFGSAEPSGEAPAGPWGAARVSGAYLEGDVVLVQGERVIRADRLYYDFAGNRAILLDGVFRTIQKQRDIPIYIRAQEVLQLSRREVLFRNAVVSTSEFHTPTYSIGATSARLEDTTPYDALGVALAEPSMTVRMKHTTFTIRGVPVWYWPWGAIDAEDTDVALRRMQAGTHGRLRWGVESEWFLFRLLGLVPPEGFSGRFHANAYQRGAILGTEVDYERDASAGKVLLFGIKDDRGNDDFGLERDDIPAPRYRGRALWRHKQLLPMDWQLQAEASYLCDRNFLESYFRDEFYAGKEQETLLYARKQVANGAVDVLIKGRINDFQTETDALPETSFRLIGQSLADDCLTLFGESRLGGLRYRPGNRRDEPGSEYTGRADQRLELNVPAHLGPVNFVPFAFGRGTYWSDAVDQNDLGRGIGGGGVKANMHIWRAYEDAHSRLFAIDGIRHIITPEGVLLLMAGNVAADETFPFSPDVEQHMEAFQGAMFGVRQRWQTHRGTGRDRRLVDFARVNVYGAWFADTKDPDQPADGRFFFDRPEYGIARNAINGDFALLISDATTVLGDMNWDLDAAEVGVAGIGLAVQRDPRLRYFLGTRYLDPADSWVGTFGLNYKLSEKYEFVGFQQYDFRLDGGENLATQLSIVRKLPRWYVGVTVSIDRATDDASVVITLWPEGIPEFRLGSSRSNSFAYSTLN